MLRTTLSISTCVVLTAATLALPLGVPRFTPKEGQTVTRTIVRTGKRTLDSVTLRAKDQEQTVEAPGLTIESELTIELEDTFQRVTDGRVTRLERAFKRLSKSVTEKLALKGEEKTVEKQEASGLAGKVVRFRFDAKQDEWSKSFAGDEGDKELLDGLSAELDLAAFLPQTQVEVDASWPIDFDAFRLSVVRPGGNLHFRVVPERVPLNERLVEAVWDKLKGKARGTWKGLRKIDGAEFAVIAVECDMQMDARVEREGDEVGPDALRVKGDEHFEGELLWDLAAGAARSLELEDKSEFVITEEAAAKAQDGSPLHIERENHFSEKETEKLAFKRE